MTPKVSVIVPVYNTEKYLRQCIDSLMTQTLKDVEYIFINNGSTDNSGLILESYALNDERIRVVTQGKNIRQGPARNLGISLAEGEYLLILDSDDFFESTLLQDTYECAVKNDADVVLFSYLHYDNKTGECLTSGLDLEKMPSDVCSPREIADFLPFITASTAWSKLFRRELILKEHIQFPKTQVSDDTYFSYIALLTAKKIARVNKQLLYYRCNQNNNTLTKVSSYKKTRDIYNTLKYIKDDLCMRGVFNIFEKGFHILVKREAEYCASRVTLKEGQLFELYRMCREFHVAPFTLGALKGFIYLHSPQWFIRFVRSMRKAFKKR